jgi:hypothetical protein
LSKCGPNPSTTPPRRRERQVKSQQNIRDFNVKMIDMAQVSLIAWALI